MSILSVPMTLRSTQRLGQIVLTLTKHGFGHLVPRMKLGRYLSWRKKFFRRHRPDDTIQHIEEKRVGQRLVAICEELGPTFVKLGQLLSSRPDILPPELLVDLQQLQDRVSPFPAEEAHAIIEAELGQPIDQLFSRFESVPLACGSIAATYRATTRDGVDVVVKVRRPGIDQIVKLDMHLLARLAEAMEKHIPELRCHRPTAIVDEFSQTITREMDLVNEATIAERVHTFFADDENIVTAAVRWDLTSHRVMTQTFVTGRNFREAIADPNIAIDRPKLARVLVDAFMRQYLELGVFNADPHPGNLLIIPPDRVALIDFGMAGQIDRPRISELIFLLSACTKRQMDLAMDILISMNAIGPETDVGLLKRDLATLLDKYQTLPLKHVNFQVIFGEINALARTHQVILPKDFVMMGKSLVSVGGVALMLDSEMNAIEVIRPRIHRAILGLFGRENLARELTLAAWHGGLLLKDLPRNLRELLRKTNRGELRVQIEHTGLTNLITEMDRSSNRLSAALITVGITIGSSLIFHARVGPTWQDMPLLGLTGYLVAGIMGLWLVIAIIRSGKLS
jgi:ubiquinone biosynthesis protein